VTFNSKIYWQFRVAFGESDFDDVANSIGSQSPDSFHQLFTNQQNLVRSRSRCDSLVAFGTAGGDDWPTRSMRELNGTSP
jgi:hypothetical protein